MGNTVAQLTVILDDLRVALNDPDGQRDPVGMFGAWHDLVSGEVTAETRYRLVDGYVSPLRAQMPAPGGLTMRQRRILAMAHQVVLTTGVLAESMGWSSQTILNDLKTLTSLGLLERSGSKRGSRYTLPVNK